MKQTLLILLAISLLGACKKDETDAQFDYAMTKYDVQVTAAERKVSILFQVIDSDGVGVDALTESNFKIYENNELVGTEAGIEIDPSLIPTTIKTVILLDRSSSVNPLIAQLKEAAVSLINLGFENQKFAIFTFDGANTTTLLQDFTADKSVLTTAINNIPNTNSVGSTDLYGSIIDVTNNSMFTWSEHYGIDYISTTNLIVFTDGKHNADPSVTLANAVSSIDKKKVYVAALQSDDLNEDALKEIATEAYVLANNKEELKSKFEEVQDKIKKLSNSLYYIYYTSPITSPADWENNLKIKIADNADKSENMIETTFNSKGFQ